MDDKGKKKKEDEEKDKKRWKFTWNICVAVFLGLMLMNFWFMPTTTKTAEVLNYSPEFIGLLETVKSEGAVLEFASKSGGEFEATLTYPNEKEGLPAVTRRTGAFLDNKEELEKIARTKRIPIVNTVYSQPSSWISLLVYVALIGGLWYFLFGKMMKNQMGGMGGPGGLLKKPVARKPVKKITFADVAGVDEAKAELVEVVEFLKNPGSFSALGAVIPKGVLLCGLPGTGKTLLVKAVAGEAGVPFFSMAGSEFVEMFVGVGAKRVRDLFEEARKNAPAIIFIDEIDAMGRARGAGIGQSHNEGEQTLNQLFTEMDGFETSQGIIILAATNRPDVLDPALLRPGRFDRQVEVPMPDVNGRIAILEVHTKNKTMAAEVDLKEIAAGTPNFSGADIEKLANEAAILAARQKKTAVDMSDFWNARDRVMMGAERKIFVNEEERRITAYHEAGHTLIGVLTETSDKVHRVTIIPRGRAMGVTSFLPKEDKHFYGKDYWLARLKMALGGRLAEELIFGAEKITTGAGHDLKVVTAIARQMVCDWAMSDELPMRTFGNHQEMVFLGRDLGRERDFSEELAGRIDNAVQKIIDECAKAARELMAANKEKLEKIAKGLLEKETLEAKEILAIVHA